MPAVVIVNLGTGNLRSVHKALEHVGAREVRVSSAPSEIRNAGHLVLPGQGAIGTWMRQLDGRPELAAAVKERLSEGPVLGICLGLQALYAYSEENGGVDCLGQFAGNVRHFASEPDWQQNFRLSGQIPGKIPHMGWNRVRQSFEHPLWHGIEDQKRFYFVHSYYVEAARAEEIAGMCRYGNWFTAAAARDNIFATQFHPEKSQQDGLRLLSNFIHWNGVPYHASDPCD